MFKNGFNPFALGLTGQLQAAFGISRQESFEYWKNTIVARDTSDWNICPGCMSKLSPYLEGPPKPTGVTKAEIPSKVFLETFAEMEAKKRLSSPVPTSVLAPQPKKIPMPPKPISRTLPIGVKVLAALELLSVPSFIATGYYLYIALNQAGADPALSALGPGLSGALSLVLLLSAVGLWKGKGWGLMLSMMFAVIMVLLGLMMATLTVVGGLMTVALGAAVIFYLTRPHVRDHFRSKRPP